MTGETHGSGIKHIFQRSNSIGVVFSPGLGLLWVWETSSHILKISFRHIDSVWNQHYLICGWKSIKKNLRKIYKCHSHSVFFSSV